MEFLTSALTFKELVSYHHPTTTKQKITKTNEFSYVHQNLMLQGKLPSPDLKRQVQSLYFCERKARRTTQLISSISELLKLHEQLSMSTCFVLEQKYTHRRTQFITKKKSTYN